MREREGGSLAAPLHQPPPRRVKMAMGPRSPISHGEFSYQGDGDGAKIFPTRIDTVEKLSPSGITGTKMVPWTLVPNPDPRQPAALSLLLTYMTADEPGVRPIKGPTYLILNPQRAAQQHLRHSAFGRPLFVLMRSCGQIKTPHRGCA